MTKKLLIAIVKSVILHHAKGRSLLFSFAHTLRGILFHDSLWSPTATFLIIVIFNPNPNRAVHYVGKSHVPRYSTAGRLCFSLYAQQRDGQSRKYDSGNESKG